MECLPTELIAEILAHVAAGSAVDLFRCKLCCKTLHESAAEKQVLQQAAIECLYDRTWCNADKAQYFFKRCQESDNPEALYRLGMVLYFSRLMKEEGLKNLEKAAAQAHKEAIYAWSLILLRHGDNESTTRGFKLLMSLMESMNGEGIVERRRKLRDLMHTLLWMKCYYLDDNDKQEKSYVIEELKVVCAMKEQHEMKSIWNRAHYYDEQAEDSVNCVTCKIGREVGFLCTLLTDF